MSRTLREVVFVDGLRTPFGKAGDTGLYAQTRADDLVVACLRELLRRNPQLPPDRVDEVAIAATTQTGDQGLTIGRSVSLLAGLPVSVPGYAIDRMCAGAMTAVTTTASSIAFGAIDVAIAGGVEHMGHHPIGAGMDPNPRFLADRIVDMEALSMGAIELSRASSSVSLSTASSWRLMTAVDEGELRSATSRAQAIACARASSLTSLTRPMARA